MAKYKVGDKVRVKSSRTNRERCPWVNSMDKFLGKTVTIRQVDGDDNTYKIQGTEYWFCEEAFEGLENSTGNKIIDLLMKELGVGIDEEFEISTDPCHVYHFDKDGRLFNNHGDEEIYEMGKLIYKEKFIKKIPKPEIKEMTVGDIEKELKLPAGTLRIKKEDK